MVDKDGNWYDVRTHFFPTRECECGEPTDREGLCDECTGQLREFCGFCGRDGLRGVEAITTHRLAPRHKADGVWCPGAGSILEVNN